MDARITKQPDDGLTGWRQARGRPSLQEVFGSITTRPSGSFWRKLTAFLGPGYLVAVGTWIPATGRRRSRAAPNSVMRCSPSR